MNYVQCDTIHEWLTTNYRPASVPSTAICDHVIGCARCRGGLFLLMTELLQIPSTPRQIDCDTCGELLAAYTDIVREEGEEQAVATYPDVWWHLWTCHDCAELYEMLDILGDEEARQTLPKLALPAQVAPASTPQKRSVQTFVIPRSIFAMAFKAELAHSWDVPYLAELEHDQESYSFSVTSRQQNGQISFLVLVEPPIDADAVLTIGERSFREHIDPDGRATITVAAAILSGQTPRVTIKLEPAE